MPPKHLDTQSVLQAVIVTKGWQAILPQRQEPFSVLQSRLQT